MEKQLYIVDDNPDHHFLLHILLKEHSSSCRVKFFEAGNTFMNHLLALHHTRQILPTLIILDLNMPGTNGIQLLKRLKGDLQDDSPPFRHIPVIIMSSETNSEKISMCYEAGANAYVEKPLNFDQMKVTLKSICDFWLHVNYIPH